MHTPTQAPVLLDNDAAAKLLGLSPKTLTKWRSAGRSPRYLKIGRRVLYSVEDLVTYLAARRRRSTSDVGEEG